MSHAMSLLRRTIRDRLGWKGVGLVLSLTIAVIAFYALAQALRNIDVDHVRQAIWLTEPWRIALAACLVAACYLSLTFYDLLALRIIGRREIPYRIAALANFTSYPIAHGVGAVLPVSTAIRYRIYSVHGLSAIEVAKICFLTGLTFWLGNLTALGLCMLHEPDAVGLIDRLPRVINQVLAVGILVLMAA